MTVTISGLGRRFQLAGVLLVLVALAIAVFAHPASAAPSGMATPNADLSDTGTLALSASGFATDGSLHFINVLECELGATDSSQCDANTVDGNKKSNTAGTYTNSAYTYYALPNAAFGGFSAITCDSTHPCGLVLIQDDYNDFSKPHVEIPITFAGVAATSSTVSTTTGVPPSTTTTAPAGATSTVFVAGTTVPSDATTAVTGTTTVDGTSTTAKGTATTLNGQGGSTVPVDPGGGSGSVDGGSGGSLPFTGPPTAAPIVAVCGLVILFAGTLMRRVVLRVPDSGVSLS